MTLLLGEEKREVVPAFKVPVLYCLVIFVLKFFLFYFGGNQVDKLKKTILLQKA